jgi:hypothetical protein
LAMELSMAAIEIGDSLLDLGDEVAAVERELLGKEIVEQELVAQRGGKLGVSAEAGDEIVELARGKAGAIFEVAVQQ